MNNFLIWTPIIHLLNKYLLAAYFVPKSIPETRDKMMNKTVFILKKTFQASGEVGQNVGNSLMAGNSAIVWIQHAPGTQRKVLKDHRRLLLESDIYTWPKDRELARQKGGKEEGWKCFRQKEYHVQSGSLLELREWATNLGRWAGSFWVFTSGCHLSPELFPLTNIFQANYHGTVFNRKKKKNYLHLEGYISCAWGHLSPLQGVMLNTRDTTSNKTQSHLNSPRGWRWSLLRFLKCASFLVINRNQREGMKCPTYLLTWTKRDHGLHSSPQCNPDRGTPRDRLQVKTFPV